MPTEKYPAVRSYGNMDVESFDSYYGRWPSSLSSIPKPVVEDWIYRHWNCFKNRWIRLRPDRWTYELSEFTNDKILAIDHVLNWIPELDAEGVEYVSDFPRAGTKLAQFMLGNGTFPVPIIVAADADHVTCPNSGGKKMKAPLQLIEGHTRLACIRGMINASHPALLPSHKVWLVRIPSDLR